MKREYIKDLKKEVGNEVKINGWVDTARDQGKMAFFEFRDVTGKVQGVVFGKPEVLEIAKTLRDEDVVEIEGVVQERNDKTAKQAKEEFEKTGKVAFFVTDVELEITKITVLNKAETPVFDITKDTREISEEVRMKYKYLDLRSQRMQKNIKARSDISNFVRQYFINDGFCEIQTPLLTKTTPEGARDYLVPSRIYPGKFYALPQSPQQYKQLLMSSGFEKYFQFAVCMRDEDLRGDRQPEFTQMDLEMSFVTEEDVMQKNEEVLIQIVKKFYPEKRIQEVPFPRITYKEAMEKYGSDRPDLREDKNDQNLLAFCWVVDFPFFEKTAESDDPQAVGEWTFTHNPFSMPKEEHLDNLMNKENIGEIQAQQYDIVLNGFEIGGGSVRAHKPEILEKTLEIIGYDEKMKEQNLSHMFEAFKRGTPPHGGIAWGFDRLVMLLENEENIREVIAFPKTREARELLFDSPSDVTQKQLDELCLKVDKKEEKEKKD
ncbi:hypothetical protein CSB11_02515 [Candidatus Campbellbacteria bacterium]|nr:MAG: hypothetical protein CSB11_02515 [Candidatus Campbellbacteria bacterium]